MFHLRALGLLLAVASVLLLGLPPAAQAKLTLHFSRDVARPGDRIELSFGAYFTNRGDTVHVYLVPASILTSVIKTEFGTKPRLGPPPQRRGVVKIGTTLSGSKNIVFRLPRMQSGRYAGMLWCSTCATRYLLASFPGSVPDDAYVRPDRRLLRVLRSGDAAC